MESDHTELLRKLAAFLQNLQRLTCEEENVILPPRHKNVETWNKLELDETGIITEIRKLTIANYYKGPEIDRNKPQSSKFWMFGKTINDIEIYIKIKITSTKKHEKVIVVSFHEAEQKIQYPLR